MKIALCLIFAALFMICGLASVSTAQTTGNKPGIDAIQHQQQLRIADGVRDGSLTAAEAQHLRDREAGISRLEAKFRESGNALTPMERRRLLFLLNQTSHMIFRLRHNQQSPKP